MKKIISIRPKSDDPTVREQFIRGSDRTVQNKIIRMINSDPNGNYDFIVIENGVKTVKNVNALLGEVINIIDDNYVADFTEEEDGTSLILVSHPSVDESLPQQHTLDQLKKVRKASKGIDIGDRISDINNTVANIQYIRNPVDTGIETQQDFDRSKDKFKPNWNLKRMKLYKDFNLPLATSHKKSNTKKKGK